MEFKDKGQLGVDFCSEIEFVKNILPVYIGC